MSFVSRWLGIFALVGAVWFAAGRARAYEDTFQLDLGLGYGARVANEPPHHGVLLAAQASVGIGNAFSVRGFARYGAYFGGAGAHVGVLGAEAIYLLDILEVVPFFGLGVGGVGTFSPGGAAIDFEVHPVVGADWLIARDWVLGVDLRAFFLPASWSTTPVAIDVILRAGILFEV